MRIVNKMLNHSLDAAMMTWKDHARKEQRATTVCARVVSHWQHRCKANAFESWHLHTNEQRRHVELGRRAVRGSCHMFRQATPCWHDSPRTRIKGRRALAWSDVSSP